MTVCFINTVYVQLQVRHRCLVLVLLRLNAPVIFFSHVGTALRERLRTHKVFAKDQCFYLNYHKFSIKSYVLDVY